MTSVIGTCSGTAREMVPHFARVAAYDARFMVKRTVRFLLLICLAVAWTALYAETDVESGASEAFIDLTDSGVDSDSWQVDSIYHLARHRHTPSERLPALRALREVLGVGATTLEAHCPEVYARAREIQTAPGWEPNPAREVPALCTGSLMVAAADGTILGCTEDWARPAGVWFGVSAMHRGSECPSRMVPHGPKIFVQRCEQCGDPFVIKDRHSERKFCSLRCNAIAREVAKAR